MLISTLHFVERTVIDLEIGTVLSVDDIRSLYTKISHDLGLKALKYWIEKMQKKNKTFTKIPQELHPRRTVTYIEI